MPEHSKYRLCDVKAMLDLILLLVLSLAALPVVAVAAMQVTP